MSAIFMLSLPQFVLAARPLFSESELAQLQRLKSREYTFAAAIAGWRAVDKEFFKNVLQSTAQEDLAQFKASLPQVRQQMQHEDEALWLKNVLHEMSQQPSP